MNKKNFTIRNYCPEDFNNYLQFYKDANQLEHSGLYVTPKLLAEDIHYPLRSPEKDLFFALKEENIIGCCEVIDELKIGRILLDALVHPLHRKQGIGTELLKCALARGYDLGAKKIHVDIIESNEPGRRFLLKNGFKIVRRYLNMQLDLNNVYLPDTLPTTFQSRFLHREEERLLTLLQNRYFEGSWGFKPNTVEEIHYLVNSWGGGPEDVILLFDGENPVGYCWTRINREENLTGKIKKGRIHMMGVDPGFRGQGIGKITLMEGIRHLKSQGVQIVELTSDKNNIPAYKLYQSQGFELHSVILWFEKTLY